MTRVVIEADCDLCKQEGIKRAARFDDQIAGTTTWAYMCTKHQATRGTGIGNILRSKDDK